MTDISLTDICVKSSQLVWAGTDLSMTNVSHGMAWDMLGPRLSPERVYGFLTISRRTSVSRRFVEVRLSPNNLITYDLSVKHLYVSSRLRWFLSEGT